MGIAIPHELDILGRRIELLGIITNIDFSVTGVTYSIFSTDSIYRPCKDIKKVIVAFVGILNTNTASTNSGTWQFGVLPNTNDWANTLSFNPTATQVQGVTNVFNTCYGPGLIFGGKCNAGGVGTGAISVYGISE
jgi:hypothetical protein